MRSLIQQLALSYALIGALSACATPPAQDFEKLCASEAGMVVYEAPRLPPERFTPDGHVIELKGRLSNAFGPDYTIRSKEVELDPEGKLRRTEDHLYRNSDGKLMASKTRYIKRGPYILGFEPKVSSCPALGAATFHDIFIQ